MREVTENHERIRIIYQGMRSFPNSMDSQAARIMLAAIAYQESAFRYTRQIKGPARGLWQFELGGGVKGVMTHRSSSKMAREACGFHGVQFKAEKIYEALEHNDLLACAFARLLLWTDPRPLPTDMNEAWDYYNRNWRPGKPHPERWAKCWADAHELWENKKNYSIH